MSSIFSDGTVMTEGGWGNDNHDFNDFKHIADAKERRKVKAKAQARSEKIRRWQAVRANWTPEMVEAEEARLRAEIEEWARARDAA